MNFPLALYNRQRPSRFLSAASPFIAVLLTLLIGCLIFAGMGKDPMHSMYVFIVEPLLTLRGLGELRGFGASLQCNHAAGKRADN